MMNNKFGLSALLLIFCLGVKAQQQWNSSRILHEIRKLPVQTTVLYVAAHPDDENTRMISWLANELKCRTAYLSLTRGDGGQNLIGTELGVELGIIRTHELDRARKTDGGEQYFTRAYDFGFSKSPEETFRKWQRDSILSDLIYVIRSLQPDIIITRFPSSSYPTHGHHTASAILAEEAFEKAADPEAFPEQLQYGVVPWKSSRIYFNASPWWNPDLPKLAQASDSFFVVDVGGFNPLLGASYSEIAGKSRSMHKSQGFGSAEPVGPLPEYLRLTGGSFPKGKDPFGDLLSLNADKEFNKIFNKISQNFDFENPGKSLTDLVKESSSPSAVWKYKTAQLEKIIWQCSGISFKILATEKEFTQGEKITAEVKVVNRSQTPLKIREMLPGMNVVPLKGNLDTTLAYNRIFSCKQDLLLSQNWYSQAPWLSEGLGEAMFNNSWRNGGTLPGTDHQYACQVVLEIHGQPVSFWIPVEYEFVDPVKGEIRQEIMVSPKVSLNYRQNLLIFTNHEKKFVEAEFLAGEQTDSRIITSASGGFSLQGPEEQRLFLKKDSFFTLLFPVKADLDVANGFFKAELPVNHAQIRRIAYDHIGVHHHAFQPQVKLSKLLLKKSERKIAYIQGAGDEVDKYLRLADYQVETIDLSRLVPEEIKKYDVLIFGIRAYNTLEIKSHHTETILRFIENGGHVIMQYNTSRGLKNENLGPFPFKLGNERVTEEEAEMRFTDENHPLLHFPHRLNAYDFESWVQERGLYFVKEADGRYEKVFLCNDTGEKELSGALIVAKYGKGSFIYTGISFFRQLPAGVPGAYRLIGNLIEYGNTK
jgi:LmbE family N-acetylglucosaminyl deacetylase